MFVHGESEVKTLYVLFTQIVVNPKRPGENPADPVRHTIRTQCKFLSVKQCSLEVACVHVSLCVYMYVCKFIIPVCT